MHEIVGKQLTLVKLASVMFGIDFWRFGGAQHEGKLIELTSLADCADTGFLGSEMAIPRISASRDGMRGYSYRWRREIHWCGWQRRDSSRLGG
ncbi:hypothetical protein GCM10027040_29860 [Halomonas shantousis]